MSPTAHHLPLKMEAMTAAADRNCTFGGLLPSIRRNDSDNFGVGHSFARIAKNTALPAEPSAEISDQLPKSVAVIGEIDTVSPIKA